MLLKINSDAQVFRSIINALFKIQTSANSCLINNLFSNAIKLMSVLRTNASEKRVSYLRFL
jgi:hypothetical protein